MSGIVRCTAAVLLVVAIGPGYVRADEPGEAASVSVEWQGLFNGHDLTGWEANARPESFSVVDGVLKAHGIHAMAHLFVVDEEGEDMIFRDFELVAVIRAEPNSNSGIFFHTGRELRGGRYLNKGYEVQLNSTGKEPRKTGSLYAVVDLDSSPVDETEWFELRLRVEGRQIAVFIDDEPVIDYLEPDSPERPPSRRERLIDPNGGALAIQAHDPDSVFYFREIRVRSLNEER